MVEDRLSPQDQIELIDRVAAAGDREAFARLFDYFAPRLNAYLQKLGLDRGAAEEITQEVMVTLWRKAALFNPEKSSVATWLYRIARNLRIDVQRRERLTFVDPQGAALEDVGSEELGADIVIDLQLRDDLLRAALARLPEEQLALVRFAFFDGLSHADIALRTGLPLGTVKSRIRLAFARLRHILETTTSDER